LDDQARIVHNDQFGMLLFSARWVDVMKATEGCLGEGAQQVKGGEIRFQVEEIARSVNSVFFLRSIWNFGLAEGRRCLTRKLEITNGRATVRRKLVYEFASEFAK
jgi:hypothetical protein